MSDKLKTLGSSLLWILLLLVPAAVLMVFLRGAEWMSERVLQPLINIAALVFAINLFILLPLAIFRRSRSFAGTGLYLSSFLFGFITWFLGLVLTLSIWGTAATVIGLLFAGIGVVPMAMLATLLRGMWPELFWLTVYVLITLGVRTVGTLLVRQGEIAPSPLTTRQMHTTTLLTDGDWAQIDGRLCLVTEFVPMAKVKDGQITAIPGAPYASVQLTSERSERVKGFITHKTDFAMLWAAFNARAQVPATRLEVNSSRDLGIGLGGDEEVCVIWTRNNYSGVSQFLGRILPKLAVMVCAKGVFNSLMGRDDAGEMVKALAWIKWTPEVMKS